jgi:hypothetical protein
MDHCCQICYEEFGKKDKKQVECGYCDTGICVGCVKIHILSLPGEPACPACKNIWNMDFCQGELTQKFMNKEYKHSRMELMFKSEEHKVSKTMRDVENMIESESYDQKIKDNKDELQELQAKLNAKKDELRDMREKQKNLKKPNYIKNDGFKMKCPNIECSGFLKRDYSCILCEKTFCHKCLENVNIISHNGESKIEDHECDPDLVATIAMIHKESKPCPGCSEPISKINGCDQMWCVKCRIAFSWETGDIDYGRVHNPHFVEWKKHNGQDITRQPGEILCGGLPDKNNLKYFLECAELTSAYQTQFPRENFHIIYKIPPSQRGYFHQMRGEHVINLPIFKNTVNQERFFSWLFFGITGNINHFRGWTLDWYRREALKEDITRNFRIKFIRKQITEDVFKKNIYRLMMKKRKNMEILHIFELCYVVSVEQINEIFKMIIGLNDDPCNKYKNDYYKNMINEIGKKQTLYNYKNYRENMWLKFYPKIVQYIENIENIIHYSNQELYKIGIKYKTMTPFVTNSYNITDWAIKNWRSYPFQNKKYSLQKLHRTKYDRENQDWHCWDKDQIPIKGLFGDDIFEKKLRFRNDGSWYVHKIHKQQQNDEAEEAVINQGGIRV